MVSTPATLSAAEGQRFPVGAHCGGWGYTVWRTLILSVTLQRSSWFSSVHGSPAPGASGGEGGGCGGVGGGLGEGGGGEGGERSTAQLSVEGQVSELAKCRATLLKAGLPAHAQRMSSLFSSDKRRACCRVEGRGTCDAGRGAGREAGGCGVVAAQAACSGKGPTQGCWGPGHARSARRTCSPCS